MVKLEAELVSRFGAFMKRGGGFDTLRKQGVIPAAACLEFKAAHAGRAIAFNSLKPWQSEALKRCKCSTGVWHKISDMSIGYKPCDVLCLSQASGLVVVGWKTRGGGWVVVALDVDAWLDAERKARAGGGRRSLRPNDAVKLGVWSGRLSA